MRAPVPLLAGIVATLLTTFPASAQEVDVRRRSFAFFDRTLTVEVAAQAPGELHVVRGGRGRVEVAARGASGVTSAAMGGVRNDRLRLAAAGADYVEYTVVVPEQVQLHVVLPDGESPLLDSGDPATIYRWEPQQELRYTAFGGAERGLALTYTDATAPTEVAVTDLSAVRRLAIRVQGDDFRISSSRPLQLEPGSRDRLEIRPWGTPIDLVFQVPTATRNFVLRAGSDVAVSIRDGQVDVRCTPMTQQVLADGRRWVDLTPQAGRITCR